MAAKKKAGPTSRVVSIRFRTDMLSRLEAVGRKTGVPVHRLIQAYVEWALDELDVGRGLTADEIVASGLLVQRGRPGGKGGGTYFLEAGGLVKIGWAPSIATLRAPKRGVILLVVPGKAGDDERIRERFTSARVRGQWYRPTVPLMNSISMLRGFVEERAKRDAKKGSGAS